MQKEEIKETYTGLIPKYKHLAKNLENALSLLLLSNNIQHLSITSRIKDTKSFLEKADRKSYENPLAETEDICGIRVICYYNEDLLKIAEIINQEFQIHTSEDKEELLDTDQFGYRSYHFVISIKQEWLQTPNYKGLGELKAEVQVRTVLMHGWAEIMHNLSYKKKDHIPQQFLRKLFRISAKLEEADEQFQDLKKESETYRNIVSVTLKKENETLTNEIDLNLDSLQAYLDSKFPSRLKSLEATRQLLDIMTNHKVTIADIDKGLNKLKSTLPAIEEETFKESQYSRWAQTGIARMILDLTNKDFLSRLNRGKRLTLRKRLIKEYVSK